MSRVRIPSLAPFCSKNFPELSSIVRFARTCHSARVSDSHPPKHSKPLAVISLLIGLAALIGFIVLNRLMAPPFPKFATKPGQTNSAAEPTNSSTSTNK
jgi:hypothetical protein